MLFVDDALITGPDDQVNELLKNLYKEFKIKSNKEVTTFLGMEFEKTEKGLKITQTKKIIKLLEIFNMRETRSVATPMEQNF